MAPRRRRRVTRSCPCPARVRLVALYRTLRRKTHFSARRIANAMHFCQCRAIDARQKTCGGQTKSSARARYLPATQRARTQHNYPHAYESALASVTHALTARSRLSTHTRPAHAPIDPAGARALILRAGASPQQPAHSAAWQRGACDLPLEQHPRSHTLARDPMPACCDASSAAMAVASAPSLCAREPDFAAPPPPSAKAEADEVSKRARLLPRALRRARIQRCAASAHDPARAPTPAPA